MRKTSTWWRWAVGVALLGGSIWRCSHAAEHTDTIETTLHVKLAPGVTAEWASNLDHANATVLEDSFLFDRSVAELSHDRAEAESSGEPMPDLHAWHRVRLKSTREGIDKTLASLQARADVLAAFEAPKAELPVMLDSSEQVDALDGESCPIKTPSYEKHQGYLGPAPGGINAAAMWRERGGRGDGVWFADIEGAWNAKHEDLPGERIRSLGREMDDRGWEMHGTAVLGEVVSKDNRLGMMGIAPDVSRVVVSSIALRSPALAIDRAQAELRRGDVLLIELHAVGPRRKFLPMEYWDDVYDAIKVATGRGVIVIEAAGNGAEDLDHEAYGGKLDRTKRDSGAIMVGAGAPDLIARASTFRITAHASTCRAGAEWSRQPITARSKAATPRIGNTRINSAERRALHRSSRARRFFSRASSRRIANACSHRRAFVRFSRRPALPKRMVRTAR